MGRRGPTERILLTLSASGLLLGALYLGATLRYPRGALAQPGPGLYPLLLGTLLVIACLGIAAEVWAGRRDIEQAAWPRGEDRRRVLVILGASLGYVVSLQVLGHPAAGTMVLLVVFRVMGMRNWGLALALAAAMALGSQYLFGVLLDVPLPTGFWFGWEP
jgi:putative tricarboxylic transport membrane protein